MKGKDKKKITVNIIIIIIIIAGLYLFSTYESSNTAIPETPKTDTTIESENNNIIEQHDDHDTPILKELMKDYPRDHAQAGEAVLSYITSQRLNATVQHITLENGLYNVNISLANRDVIVYVTSDKKSFVTGIASVETFIDKSIYNLLKDNKTISVEQAGKIGLGILKAQDQEPSVIQEINIESGLYHVKMESWGRNISIYLTPNGKYIAQGIIPRDNLISNKQPVKELSLIHI